MIFDEIELGSAPAIHGSVLVPGGFTHFDLPVLASKPQQNQNSEAF